MVKLISAAIGISLIANLCSLFAMDTTPPGPGFMLQPIQNPQALKDKLGITYERVLATIEQSGTKLAHMPKNSVYALVSDAHGAMVGFIGCHQEKEKFRIRVILDKLYLRHDNETNQKRVAQMLFCYALEKHTKAKSICIPLERTSTFDDSLQAFGFKPSRYQSKQHDPAVFQSWEVDRQALTQVTPSLHETDPHVRKSILFAKKSYNTTHANAQRKSLHIASAPAGDQQADAEHQFTFCPIVEWNDAMIDILKEKGIVLESISAESQYAVLFDKRSKLVGFIGCNGDEKQIEISKLYVQHEDGDTQREIARLLLTFAFEKHPQVRSMYIPLLKESTLIPILVDCGFESSSYLDAAHDKATYGAYECSFEMLYLSCINL